ncbi:GGDEF domain-containing protein [Gilvimarinus sp. DA14]|uniref:GGDEF domain-containing protein n=1 Tax=Gilvimarinus sp. DA14 TaxID=2956798 RepID=UPI0020B85577|nr:GGDEF domain-containing protein [Gilvimarinus sp. DA14]UTF60962.1 GGDEF domain-containing protein [Gilvimarinus sp. DA14]
MQDLSPTATANTAEALRSGIFTDASTTSALLEARARLAHALQTSLDAAELLPLFYRHSRGLIDYSGLTYNDADGNVMQLGHKSVHSCRYNLTLPDADLGSISFFRKQRFSESEQQCMETLLASLAFPLRNAQRYQNALRMALIDPLTQVGNRAALDRALEREHQLLQRSGQPFALLMIDIDHFKQINDRYGHGVGDKIIASVASTIDEVSRGTDMTFRFGGEEFALILSATGAAGALITAERLRRAVEKVRLLHDGHSICATASIGVSACAEPGEAVSQLIERADAALYKAKRAGRNRSCCEAPYQSASQAAKS